VVNPGETLRIGIVGAGAIAQVSHFPAFTRIPGVKVTAVCDVDRAKAERVASRYNVPRITDSFEVGHSAATLAAAALTLGSWWLVQRWGFHNLYELVPAFFLAAGSTVAVSFLFPNPPEGVPS
jgi:hypothetical protein